jgi:hypothetical protein
MTADERGLGTGRGSPEELPLGRPNRLPLAPGHLPSPTLWPPALALGITLTFWGLVSSRVILGAGAVVMVCGLIGWINELRHER